MQLPDSGDRLAGHACGDLKSDVASAFVAAREGA